MNWGDLIALLRKWGGTIRQKGLLDGFLYETERDGLEGEPARARYSLKLAAIYSGPFVLLWGIIGLDNKPWSILTAIALTAAILIGIPGALLSAFHTTTVCITRLPKRIQGIAQVILALVLWLAPIALFLPTNADITLQQLLLGNFQPATSSVSWEFWVIELIYVYFVYLIAFAVPPKFFPIRSYLALTPVVFIVAVICVQTGSPENRIVAASVYLWHIAMGYGAIYTASLRRRRLSKTIAQRRMKVLNNFGAHAAKYPWDAIRDVSCLPHPKEEIRDALFAAICAVELQGERESALKNDLSCVLTGCLPRYQEGVGEEPLYSGGYDLSELTDLDDLLQARSDVVKEKRRSSNAERYKQMEVLTNQESAGYFELLSKLPSNVQKKGEFEEIAELLRQNDHSISKWIKFASEETRKLVKVIGLSKLD